MKQATHRVRDILEANELPLQENQWQLLQQWVALLLEYNQKLNLVSRKDTHQIWEKHILHSLALLKVRNLEPGTEICDLGTGGGLPGIPLAIACPDSQFTLIDSTQKKIKVLQSMIAALSLPNVHAIAGRAEELGQTSSYRRRFSIFTAKAVAPLLALEKWTRQLRAPHSVLHAYKGGSLHHEIQALSEIQAIKHITQSTIHLKKTTQFSENQKQIVSLYF